MKVPLLAFAAVLTLSAPAGDKDKLQAALGDNNIVGKWYYDDFDGGMTAADKTGKPLMVVLRCVPCKGARTIDDLVSGRKDPELAKLMDKFVCVRIVQGHGLDLSLFQFDWRASWQVFLMNVDRDIYGRYDAREANDLIGLRKAMEGALELHAKWPANQAELAGKAGKPMPWKSPELIPGLRDDVSRKPVTGRNGCIHCHNIPEAAANSLKAEGKPVPEALTAPYPMPQRAGIMLSTKERATVSDIDKSSPAEKAGLQEGDRILRMNGQPMLSWADVQWVLYSNPDPAPIKIEIDRGGKPLELRLVLPPGWRSR